MAAGLFVQLAFGTADAQSLADVARQEEARRRAVRAAGKVYTNENLKAEPPSPAAPVPAPASPDAPASADAGAAVTAGSPAPDAGGQQPEAPKKDDAYWRTRLEEARDALARARTFAEALQSRINALTTDFANRDDPAQRARVGVDREKALAELDRVNREIQQHSTAIAGIQEEGRRAGVPAGWLR